jgi:hypothetical protein
VASPIQDVIAKYKPTPAAIAIARRINAPGVSSDLKALLSDIRP